MKKSYKNKWFCKESKASLFFENQRITIRLFFINPKTTKIMKMKKKAFSEHSGIMSNRSPPCYYKEFRRTKEPIKSQIL